jgi:hypothetical protein
MSCGRSAASSAVKTTGSDTPDTIANAGNQWCVLTANDVAKTGYAVIVTTHSATFTITAIDPGAPAIVSLMPKNAPAAEMRLAFCYGQETPARHRQAAYNTNLRGGEDPWPATSTLFS